MRYWLLKSEPGCYSLEDLQKDTKTSWGGIRNYQARNFLRDEMKKGDLCLFHYSNAEPAGVMGICEVTKEGYPDPTQFDTKDDHYDADSDMKDPRWFAVDVAYAETFKRLVSIGEMRGNPKMKHMKLLEKGSRLSVLPVSKTEFEEVVRMGNS